MSGEIERYDEWPERTSAKRYPSLPDVSKVLRSLSVADIRAATPAERQEFVAICDGISSCINAQDAYERDYPNNAALAEKN